MAFYEATDGDGWENTTGWLTDAPLDEWHGVTTDRTGRVTELTLTLNGLTGMLPREIGYLTELTVLDLSINHELTGDLPTELGNLTNLELLNLTATLMTGELPRELGNLTNLKTLNIDGQLSGPLPRELGNLTSLVELEISFNKLSGELPRELGNLTNLQRLHLAANRLSGELPPELGRLKNLRGLFLSRNQFTGEIPPELGNLSELTWLGLENNDLHGEIPPTLGGLTSLTVLDLRFNRLSGDFPNELKGLESLEYMGLLGNEGLTGCLPEEMKDVDPIFSDEIGVYLCSHLGPVHPGDREALTALYNATDGPNWSNSNRWLSDDVSLAGWHGITTDDSGRVTVVDLGSNKLAGALPSELGELTELMRLILGANSLEGEIPRALGNLTGLEEISLRWNQLTGEIPAELGNLTDLQGLFLYGNQLSGEIPAELGNLSRLRSLELDDNQLSGAIPRELENIPGLGRLYLNENSLTGCIPFALNDIREHDLADLGLPFCAQSATSAPPSAASTSTPPNPYADQVFRTLQQLTEEFSPRESASEQELEAAHHLVDRLTDLGYETSLQEFSVTLKRARVELASRSKDTPESPRGRALIDSPHETATGRLVYVGRAYEEDIPAEGLDGRIALVARGEITFEEKVNRVAQAGAVGAIIFNNRKSEFYDWYAVSPRIPVVAISQADGRILHDLVERDDLEATVSVGMEDLSSQNVIALVPSDRNTDRTVVIGAHYDTVVSTQGASDNGSGVSAVLAMAGHIRGHSYPFDVRVVLFGAEEDGLHGSNHYVDNMGPDEIANTVAMLNFDAIGSGTGLLLMGDDRLALEARRIALRRYGMEMGTFSEDRWAAYGGAGDHAPFRTAGIPVLSLISDETDHINSPADEMQHINPELLGRATEIGLLMLEWLGKEGQ